MSETLAESERDALEAIWNDLVTKLRQRLTSLEAKGSLMHPALSEPLRNEFIATTEGGFLSVWLNTDTGNGSWNQLSPDDACEPWSVTPDGVAILSGRHMTVDDVADEFAAKLTSRAL